ncbi:TetR/AcrR family transcriptional regulator [Agitococcus lubricus]|uniref:TetR family transcriptional regulator n=1 Tax=Agitococcus lubricus TaxID=1077255 RepID=A0A2T5ITR4_9GAMM|nr:TetR/AcrR family transcriptional regulator [Agitococcus lubricus]PTQ87213.1 TetR family transcriptional regulator [Agitococcus lubricus]
MEKLSGIYDAQAVGLPRGRTSNLLSSEVREQQRRRLVKAAIHVFAEKGFVAATIADIVKGARVSRQVFYELFDSKEDCFLAADQLGRKALIETVLIDLQKTQSALADDRWLRSAVRAYLQLCTQEPEFAKAWAIEFPNAGARCLIQRNLFFTELGQRLKVMHSRIKTSQPEQWRDVPDLFYQAAIGGAYEIVFRCICQNRFEQLLALEDVLVDFINCALGYRQPIA